MKISAARRYLIRSGAVALATGLLIAVVAAVKSPEAVPWSLAGWTVMALTGCLCGAWMAARHGDPGPGFLLALGTCMLARLFAAALGAAAAVAAGMTAVWAYLAGLGVAFLTMQTFEMAWFLRASRHATNLGQVAPE